MFGRLFLEHPRSVGESYLQHQRKAFGFGLSLLGAGIACLVHGMMPSLFLHTGSQTVSRLHERMVMNRTRGAAANLLRAQPLGSASPPKG